MSDEPATKPPRRRSTFAELIGAKAARKLRARRDPRRGVWFGLGMMGLIGWSVAVPTVLGASLGLWLDHRASGQTSWTLTLLLLGAAVGCLNAWYWVAKEVAALRDDEENLDD